jgi:hypothetical protein
LYTLSKLKVVGVRFTQYETISNSAEELFIQGVLQSVMEPLRWAHAVYQEYSHKPIDYSKPSPLLDLLHPQFSCIYQILQYYAALLTAPEGRLRLIWGRLGFNSFNEWLQTNPEQAHYTKDLIYLIIAGLEGRIVEQLECLDTLIFQLGDARIEKKIRTQLACKLKHKNICCVPWGAARYMREDNDLTADDMTEPEFSTEMCFVSYEIKVSMAFVEWLHAFNKRNTDASMSYANFSSNFINHEVWKRKHDADKKEKAPENLTTDESELLLQAYRATDEHIASKKSQSPFEIFRFRYQAEQKMVGRTLSFGHDKQVFQAAFDDLSEDAKQELQSRSNHQKQIKQRQKQESLLSKEPAKKRGRKPNDAVSSALPLPAPSSSENDSALAQPSELSGVQMAIIPYSPPEEVLKTSFLIPKNAHPLDLNNYLTPKCDMYRSGDLPNLGENLVPLENLPFLADEAFSSNILEKVYTQERKKDAPPPRRASTGHLEFRETASHIEKSHAVLTTVDYHQHCGELCSNFTNCRMLVFHERLKKLFDKIAVESSGRGKAALAVTAGSIVLAFETYTSEATTATRQDVTFVILADAKGRWHRFPETQQFIDLIPLSQAMWGT